MSQNEDYKEGMRFLLAKAKEEHIELRHLKWIPKISNRLSKMNACKAFWENTYRQGNLKRILSCECQYDIFYNAEKCLFIWSWTSEGHSFWREVINACFKDNIEKFDIFNKDKFKND